MVAFRQLLPPQDCTRKTQLHLKCMGLRPIVVDLRSWEREAWHGAKTPRHHLQASIADLPLFLGRLGRFTSTACNPLFSLSWRQMRKMPSQSPLRFFLVCGALAARAHAILGQTVVNISTCADPSRVFRPCTTFELNPESCLCPGKGVVRKILLEISLLNVSNVIGAPSVNRTMVVVNQSYPGPTIHVTEGDWLEVTTRNLLPPGTSTVMHWHGMPHILTPFSDGVPGVTQCGIASGAEMTYAFHVPGEGTFWYHGEW